MKPRVIWEDELPRFPDWSGWMAFRFLLPKEWYGKKIRLVAEVIGESSAYNIKYEPYRPLKKKVKKK